ncbi:hypothetical protein [Arsenicicoccus sp. oral taxon 190]|uniref:hypothetical protein n=1 Tax=Arsenicicoccus sp. oral taxon 190 TaxID=1658671 RepID=UPI000679FD1C|nr:hypothetical protein [Arsenicicoccus sp. oral taxon 190]AKT51007.1 membrane protein [Arsenicicoccus sp. oral taxon 190]
MSIAAAPARIAAGLFLINSGLGKRNLPEEAAQGLRDMGAAGVPQLTKIPAKDFGNYLAYGEIALGAALLVPAVPGWLAGAGLGAFSAGLLNMYRNTPGMTVDGIRPTQDGVGLAKDVFLLGIAGTLVVDSVVN